MKILYLPNCYSQQRQREKKRKIYPVLMAMQAEWYRKQGHEVTWDKLWIDFSSSPDKVITEPEGLPFLSLPHPDREFTRWWDYQDNGNFKYFPGTYIMSASGCWHGKCIFCVEREKKWEVRDIRDVLAEIDECVKMGFKEIFDDSGTFPTGHWLNNLCEVLMIRNYKTRFGCNMRMIDVDYEAMRWAGFRMILFGLESANQNTLDRINKGVKVEDIRYIKKAAKAGLEPHIAVIFGYPWETDDDAERTLRLVHYLLTRGYAKTAQASFYNEPGIESNSNHRKYIRQIYKVGFSPIFWFNQIKNIHNIDDLKYLWKMIKTGIDEYLISKSSI